MTRLLLIVLLAPLALTAQVDVKFERVLHEFGEIFENGGEVRTQFKVFNFGSKKVSFINLEPSCGCTAVLTEDPEVLPGKYSFINVTYDPKGRPGEFFKSVQVDLFDGNNKQTVFIGIKGRVVQEIETANQVQTEITKIQLPPFTAPFRSVYDTAFFEWSTFNQWINGVTYELDKLGYLYLKLQLRLAPTQKTTDFMDQRLKNRLCNELKKRGYPNQAVLYKDTLIQEANLKPWMLGYIKLSSVQFNNDSITAPLIERVDLKKKKGEQYA